MASPSKEKEMSPVLVTIDDVSIAYQMKGQEDSDSVESIDNKNMILKMGISMDAELDRDGLLACSSKVKEVSPFLVTTDDVSIDDENMNVKMGICIDAELDRDGLVDEELVDLSETEKDPELYKDGPVREQDLQDTQKAPTVIATNMNPKLYKAVKMGISMDAELDRDGLFACSSKVKEVSPFLVTTDDVSIDDENMKVRMGICMDAELDRDGLVDEELVDLSETEKDPELYKDGPVREQDLQDTQKAPTVIATNMNPKLYKAVKAGDISFIKERAQDMERSPLLETSPKSNTILHVAVSSGHDQLVQEILDIQSCRKLVMATNSTGDLALHIASSAGHLSIVKLLVSSYLQLRESSSGKLRWILEQKNNEGNTPLHVALINKYQPAGFNKNLAKYNEVANFLIETDPIASYYEMNKKHKSPLHLAAEAGDAELVNSIIKSAGYRLRVSRKSIVHAAIYGASARKSLDVLDAILTDEPSLIKEKDDKEMTPLSYAASIGYLEGVQYLLEKSSDCAYISDQDGFFPIHTASSKGYIKVIQFFLEQYPDLSELLNRKGQNILHVAAVSGKAKVVDYMLKRNDLEMLINEKDKDGNTPLHLASEGRHPKVVCILTWDKRVRLNSLNNVGNTALDIATNYDGMFPTFRERLTWQALGYAGASRAPPASSSSRKPHNTDKYMDRVDTLLLVATLVATVTFAAGFTMPGGYDDSTGMATFLEKHMFQVFVICNTIAMYSSITIVVALIWAQLGDLNLVIAAFKFTVPILGLALTMVSVAFLAANYLVLRNLNWLAYLVLIIGSFFLLTLSILFFPLCFPSSLHHPIPRYILYYPLCLLIKVTKSDIDDKDEK